MKEKTDDIETSKAILDALSYFDIFKHPLKTDEIRRFLSCVRTHEAICISLLNLEKKKLVHQHEGYYSTSMQVETLVMSRKKNEERAAKMNRKAAFFGKIISAFPFVECVCISGSLSKGVLAKDGDIDFFIITAANRLWICRTLLILFKKIFLLNSHKYFCPNYFVGTNQLVIPDQNIFTATEISTLVPVMNYGLYSHFMQKNDWHKMYLPNAENRSGEHVHDKNNNVFKKGIEFILSGKLGEYFDNVFFKITLQRWKNKFPDFNKDKFDLRLRTRKNVSKHHPRGYQNKVLLAYEERIKNVARQLKPKPAQAA